MALPLVDLTNQTIGRFFVISRAENTARGRAQWSCQCSCGTTKIVENGYLRTAQKRNLMISCGCYKSESTKKRLTKHGHTVSGKPSPTFHSWAGMTARCTNPKHIVYKHYGGRGIKVCERWHSFSNFLEDMGEKPKGLTLERSDNNKDYSPENCYWATRKQQGRNKRNSRILTLNGISMTLSEWSEKLGVRPSVIHCRIHKLGWSIENALTIPTKLES
jgi:hypothetical protein